MITYNDTWYPYIRVNVTTESPLVDSDITYHMTILVMVNIASQGCLHQHVMRLC